jgi:uncharacterized protein YndB with AHSA1/START domain
VAAQSGLVLELRWRVNRPAERVFRALTEPAELARWWGPRGFTTSDVEIDLKTGGAYRITMQPPEGAPFHLSGEFLEIDVPYRLAYTFRWEEPDPDDRETVVQLDLDGAGSAVEMTLVHGEFATESRFELHRSGWTESLEKLRTEDRILLTLWYWKELPLTEIADIMGKSVAAVRKQISRAQQRSMTTAGNDSP